mmetsp:Transcript_15931/g.62259  ORF Transcript_15931/g.62259 Transcript_15931/m.62259 type:complete len:233 (-) Transcript_15931:370-1068(-)
MRSSSMTTTATATSCWRRTTTRTAKASFAPCCSSSASSSDRTATLCCMTTTSRFWTVARRLRTTGFRCRCSCGTATERCLRTTRGRSTLAPCRTAPTTWASSTAAARACRSHTGPRTRARAARRCGCSRTVASLGWRRTASSPTACTLLARGTRKPSPRLCMMPASRSCTTLASSETTRSMSATTASRTTCLAAATTKSATGRCGGSSTGAAARQGPAAHWRAGGWRSGLRR